MIYDAIVIGAGVTGCAVARELSRYNAEIRVLEKGEDVCSGCSKANSAIIHAGYDCAPGSMMAKMNVRGNEMMPELCEDLDIPFKRNGSFVVCIHEGEKAGIQELYDRGIENGVPDMEIISGDEARAIDPNLTKDAVLVLHAKSAGIICPFKLTIAMAENASVNGVDFSFNTAVEKLSRREDGVWRIRTTNGEYLAKTIINAAGCHADELHNMVSADKIHITPRRGDYNLLDKKDGSFVSHTIFPQPTKYGKGVLVAPTIHGNIIVGPTAIDVEDKEATATTQEGIDELLAKADQYVDGLPKRDVITSFAGLRPHEDHHEFVLGEAKDAPGFIDCSGIESPGLTSSPAIGEYIGNLLRDKLGLSPKENWIAKRKDILNPAALTEGERNELIRKKPAYGQIICRCESISEGEIMDAIHRPLGARSLDGVKRRTRAGMGRCQQGFCGPRVMEIINRELGLPLEEVTKSGGISNIVLEHTKGAANE